MIKLTQEAQENLLTILSKPQTELQKKRCNESIGTICYPIDIQSVDKNNNENKIEELIQRRKKISDDVLLLQKKRENYQKEIFIINQQMRDKCASMKDISLNIGKLKGEYNKSEKTSARVSDHAIIRYLERYKGIDIIATVNEILEHPDRKEADNGVITTVYHETEGTPDIKTQLKLIKFKNKHREL